MNNFYFIVAILFRLLNFGAVIALGIFWFRRSARATFIQLMDTKKQRHKDFEQKNDQLIADQHSLQELQQNQVAESKRLLANIHAWRSTVEQSMNAEMQERNGLHDKALLRAQKQEQQWQLLALQQAVMDPLLKNTQQQLQEKYSTNKIGSAYIQAIVEELKPKA